MIYLWYPGFASGTQEIDPTLIEGVWDDYDLPVTTARDRIKLKNPEWITDQAKIQQILMKRSMSGGVRTYVTSDRKTTEQRSFTMVFENLSDERVKALEHFLLCAEGKYVGYRDTYDNDHIILILTGDIPLVTAGRKSCGEHHTASITALKIKTEGNAL